MGQLDGKKALVTGAARGIGRAIAEKLATEGADVVACDLNRDWLTETEQAITALGRKALTLATDVSQAKSVQQTVDEALKAFGRLDILINNAGITRDGFLVRMSEEGLGPGPRRQSKGHFFVYKSRVPGHDEAEVRDYR